MADTAPQIMFLRDIRHGGEPDQAAAVAARLAACITSATVSVDIAIYDFRLSNASLADVVVGALTDAAGDGIAVRIAYDAGKPASTDHATFALIGSDPAPPGTSEWVTEHFGGTAVQVRAITAPSGNLMHSKYVVVDGAHRAQTSAVWTGSTNFTDDAWTVQEDNILILASEQLAAAYAHDFADMWASGKIGGSGEGDQGTAKIGSATVGWDFAPGDGKAIDQALTAAINAASSRVLVASMVITSHTVVAALAAAIGRGVDVSGIYDGGQMRPIEQEWSTTSYDEQVLEDWRAVKAHLSAKPSTPYTPTSTHDFMHNKIAICDEELFTGSYNFSADAEKNAENQLTITDDATIIGQFADYVTAITVAYR
jgi:phosphatidylserine/phosphatidylglycerophosphate/cardiolipin synthase-like enzyme